MAATAQRKTRGPRTPDERATDAARSAATLLEKTPLEAEFAAQFLHPIAALLRLWTSGVGDVDMEAVGVEYDKVRRYCGWLEQDIATRRMRAFEAEIRGRIAEVMPLVERAEAYLARVAPTPRPALRLAGSDDA